MSTIYEMYQKRKIFFLYNDYIFLTLIVLVSLIECCVTKRQSSTNETSLLALTKNNHLDEGVLRHAFNHIQNTLWGELMNPIPMIAATITYLVLKFTGVFGFLRLLYTIINQSNT